MPRSRAGHFLATGDGSRIPPFFELPRLLSAAENVIGDTDSAEDLRLLLAPGSSLGGARPKASIRDRDGRLALAKFPHKDDEIDTVRWEATALSLAQRAGLTIPAWRLEIVADRPALILRRFDRTASARIPFLSALSMLGADEHETRSYLELVDMLRRYGAAPKEDMREMWQRSKPAAPGTLGRSAAAARLTRFRRQRRSPDRVPRPRRRDCGRRRGSPRARSGRSLHTSTSRRTPSASTLVALVPHYSLSRRATIQGSAGQPVE